MAVRKREDEVFPNAAAIDIGATSHWVAVPPHLAQAAGDEPVREAGAMTDDLNALARWLVKLGVDTVALESTGVYWIPVFEVLEQHGLKIWLVDARQMKYVPGRKSDVQDCQWLQKLMSLGLLRAAWRPSAEVCVLRAVARQRELARMVYYMLTRGEAFVDQGQQRYEEQQRQRSIAALKRRAAALGFQINLVEAAA